MRQSSTSDRSDRLAAPLSGSAGSSRYSGGHLQGRIFGDASFPAAQIVNWWTATEWLRLHALYEMETDDGFVITVRNRVLLEESGATLTYARSHVELWAPDGPYAWLSRRIFIGTLCSLDPRPQVLIRVFQVG